VPANQQDTGFTHFIQSTAQNFPQHDLSIVLIGKQTMFMAVKGLPPWQ